MCGRRPTIIDKVYDNHPCVNEEVYAVLECAKCELTVESAGQIVNMSPLKADTQKVLVILFDKWDKRI